MSDFLARYEAMSHRAAASVIAAYSTSFSLAVRLLDRRTRRDIRNLYAVVRIADEIVDGAADLAGTDVPAQLAAYEQAVLAAPGQGFHTDPVLHAYAGTARRCRLDPDHLTAFFWSMRQDLHHTDFTPAQLDRYIYGSAEVIGLLCLRIFLAGADAGTELNHGARQLGSAFQKINFLRDLADDTATLGRSYLGPLDDAAKHRLIREVTAELDAARAVIPQLPGSARRAVTVATALFAELVRRLDAASLAEIRADRIRVPDPVKAQIVARCLVRRQ
ncbi:phytoene/squalene synthase family protein [Corynebacterium halotolerans]|uniref:phytoene/squalene synthase family protein n=1 Tax=Corynebacterium halotolerans TaxID=225326 RepID=UPI003CE8A6C5